MNNQPNNPFQTKKPKTVKRPISFVEALKEIGCQAVKDTGRAAADIGKQSVDAIFGNYPSGDQNPTLNSAEYQRQIEAQKHDQLRLKRHQEVIATPVYNQENERIKAEIEAIQEELKKLAADMAAMSRDIDKAVHEAIVNPGTYHVNFFEQLRRYLLYLRKQVTESKNWLMISQQRKQAQNYFWGQGVKKGGTSFMLSSERTVSTQAG